MSALALALAANGDTNEAESLVEEATKIRCKAAGWTALKLSMLMTT